MHYITHPCRKTGMGTIVWIYIETLMCLSYEKTLFSDWASLNFPYIFPSFPLFSVSLHFIVFISLQLLICTPCPFPLPSSASSCSDWYRTEFLWAISGCLEWAVCQSGSSKLWYSYLRNFPLLLFTSPIICSCLFGLSRCFSHHIW